MNDHLAEDIFTKNVQKIEKIYSALIKGETNAQQEVEMRVELIDVLSNIEAILISERANNKEFISQLESLRDILLDWDPYGHWFRQQKDLVDLVYKVIINAKNVVFTKEIADSSEATRLKGELDTLKSELDDLRSLIKSLVREKPDQPITPAEPAKTEQVSTSSLPWKRSKEMTAEAPVEPTSTEQPLIEENSDAIESIQDEPPLILPVEPVKIVPVVEESIEEIAPVVGEDISPILPQEVTPPTEIEEEAETIIPDEMLKKITQDKNLKTGASSVLSQMKSLISEAEKETERQLSDFKEQLDVEEESSSIPTQETEQETFKFTNKPSVVINEAIENIDQSEEIEEDPLESLVQMSNFNKEVKEDVKESDSTPSIDPYMQLLTLEAEKYRLERESEKNEADFQEGLKSKKEFDETIQQINQELSYIREQIKALRTQLNS